MSNKLFQDSIEEKENYHNLTEYDKRFDDSSYLVEEPKEIWLSLIMVKEEFQGKGVLTSFLKRIKLTGKDIIIPTPSPRVSRIAQALGFKPQVRQEDNEAIDLMFYGGVK